jgi:hypothetical protein
VALGDSTTVGVGDPMNGSTTDLSGAGARPGEGWRGWASLLADSLGSSHRVTFSNLATSGATAPLVAAEQLPETGTGPITGCAEQLTAWGALLLTVRFHDHGQVFGLPSWLRRPLWQWIEQVNTIYDDPFSRFGGIREGVPWLGRRAHDLTPWAAKMALTQLRPPTNAEVGRVRV